MSVSAAVDDFERHLGQRSVWGEGVVALAEAENINQIYRVSPENAIAGVAFPPKLFDSVFAVGRQTVSNRTAHKYPTSYLRERKRI